MSGILKQDAQHVLGWSNSEHGLQAGTFTNFLINAIAHADVSNLIKLSEKYPSLAAAVGLYKYSEDGIEQLQKIATAKQNPDPTTCKDCGGSGTVQEQTGINKILHSECANCEGEGVIVSIQM